MADKVTYKNKVNLTDNTTIPEENKISASDMNQLKTGVNNSTTVKVDSTVKQDLVLATTRSANTPVKVQLRDVDGNVFWVETSADKVYVASVDGKGFVTQKELNEKLGAIMNNIQFWSNPVKALFADLAKYISTVTES